MPVIIELAWHAFRDAARGRVLYALVPFSVLLVAASWLSGQLAAGPDIKILKDLGLTAAALGGLLTAVLLGVRLLAGEVEGRSVYTLLAKPVRRHEVVLGKYAGLVLVLVVNVGVLAAVLYGVLAFVAVTESAEARRGWEAPAVDPALLKACFLILVQLLVVGAIALFFATFSSPVLAAAMTLGLYVVGHFNADLRALEDVAGPGLAASLATVAAFILPDLAPFNVTAEVVHAQPVPPGQVALTAATGLAYVALFLVGAMFVFSRRDLT